MKLSYYTLSDTYIQNNKVTTVVSNKNKATSSYARHNQ